MDILTLAVAATPSFIASSVEFVEALTIVLAVGTVISFKSVLLEGLEVAFIVIGFGAGGVSAMNAAIWGALAAGVVVIGLGIVLKQPLTQVPENTMKFGVGAMLTTFGIFWSAEGLGTEWPADALSLFGILAIILPISSASLRMPMTPLPSGSQASAPSN